METVCPCDLCVTRRSLEARTIQLEAAHERIAMLEAQLAVRQVGVVPTPETTSGTLHPVQRFGV